MRRVVGEVVRDGHAAQCQRCTGCDSFDCGIDQCTSCLVIGKVLGQNGSGLRLAILNGLELQLAFGQWLRSSTGMTRRGPMSSTEESPALVAARCSVGKTLLRITPCCWCSGSVCSAVKLETKALTSLTLAWQPSSSARRGESLQELLLAQDGPLRFRRNASMLIC